MELLDIYNEQGEYIGVEERNIVHEKGFWHKTVHCWLYDKLGNVFFQIRKDRGTLYTTASGHLKATESIQDGFRREIKEEIGILIDSSDATLVNVVPFKMDKLKTDGTIFRDRAFANVYVDLYDGDLTDFVFDENELLGVVLVNAKETLELFKKGKGSIMGKVIKRDKEIIDIFDKDISITNFLVNEGETLLTKYGEVLNKIIELTEV